MYVFAHILQHFYKGGIGLRQVCDWCRLLYTYRDSLNYGLLEQGIKRAGLMSEWKTFGAFAVELLGMQVEAMPLLDVRCKKEDGRCEIDANLRKKADKICKFILEVGNFGHNRDNSFRTKQPFLKRKWIAFSYKMKDFFCHFKVFPLDSLKVFIMEVKSGVVYTLRHEG